MKHPHLFGRGDRHSIATIGAKASRLLEMGQAGFRVPESIAVGKGAFEEHLRRIPSGCGDPGAEVERMPLDPGFESALRSSLPPDLGNGYAVRSSATMEDGSEHSFAGQFKTLLGVSAQDVPRAVREVWASAFSGGAAAYRERSGISGTPVSMGVLIQPLLAPEYSGVAFGFDPVDGSRRAIRISVVDGLGEGLVSGERDADEFRLVGSGIQVVRSRGDGKDTISGSMLLEIARMVRLLESRFGAHQDVEWCSVDGRLILLQTRPATTLHLVADPDDHPRLWESANIVESYPGVSSPLTLSFVKDVYGSVYREFCRIMGVEEELIAANATSFQMLGSLRGRIHYDLANWYRVLSLFPGYDLNARFMEQMMGVKERFDPPRDLVRSLRHPWVRVAGLALGMARSAWTLERETQAFHARVGDSLGRFRELDLDAMTAQELVEAYRGLERDLLSRWRAPLVNDFFAMVVHGLMRRELSKLSAESEALGNSLLAGEGGIVSSQALVELGRIADACRAHHDLVDAAHHADAESFLEAIGSHPDLDARVRSYLGRYGDRCPGELKLESIPPSLDPRSLAIQLQGWIRSDRLADKGGSDAEHQARILAEAELSRRFGRSVARRWMTWWLVRRCRVLVKNRENLRFERTRAFAAVRRIFLALGRKLAREGRISRERDVFWLTREEIFDFVEGRGFTTDLAGLVRLRMDEFRRYESEPLPGERLTTRGMGGLCLFERREPPVAAPSGDTISGLGCGPGRVRARVRVVVDPTDPGELAGCILVAQRTDPGWAPLFPLAMGLLVERGSLLSHVAIVAREMGIPAVVSIPGLTNLVHDGDLVEFDGGSGIVTVLERAEAPCRA